VAGPRFGQGGLYDFDRGAAVGLGLGGAQGDGGRVDVEAVFVAKAKVRRRLGHGASRQFCVAVVERVRVMGGRRVAGRVKRCAGARAPGEHGDRGRGE